MCRLRGLRAAFLTGLIFAAATDAIGAEYGGKYAFDWLRLTEKTRCLRITPAFSIELNSKNYKCQGEKTNTSSGVPAAACEKKGRTAEFLIFRSFAHCERERKDQLSNSED